MRRTILVLLLSLLSFPAFLRAQECTEVPAPQALILETMSSVANLGIPNEQALLSELSSSLVEIVTGDTDNAVSELESFVKKIEAQQGKQIPVDAAEDLIDAAHDIISLLLCPCLGQEIFFGFVNGDISIDLCLDDGDDTSLIKFEAGSFLGAGAGFDERNGFWACTSVNVAGVEDLVETTMDTAVFCRSLLDQAASVAGVTCVAP